MDHPHRTNKSSSMFDRRNLMKAGLGALAAPAVLKVIPVNAQSRVIKIGHVSPRTGPVAPFGEADPFILNKRFGAIVVADRIDLSLADSEALGIIGPNGAGKSTLFGIRRSPILALSISSCSGRSPSRSCSGRRRVCGIRGRALRDRTASA